MKGVGNHPQANSHSLLWPLHQGEQVNVKTECVVHLTVLSICLYLAGSFVHCCVGVPGLV